MLPKPMDPAERKRRDGRFRVAQKELEGKFSDLINQFMSDSSDGKNATEFAAHYLAEKAGLKVNERVYIDDPPMLKPVPGRPGFDMKFGELESFFNGLEELIGLPASGFLKKVMRDEHCERDDSDKPFETANYHLKTTSHIEWWFVVAPAEGRAELNKIDCYKEGTWDGSGQPLHRWPEEDPTQIEWGARRQPAPAPAVSSP